MKLPEYTPLKSQKEIIELYKLETKAIKENYDRMIKESYIYIILLLLLFYIEFINRH